MKNLFILLLLIVCACAPNDSTNNTVNAFNLESNKNYIFDEYVTKLLLINKSKSYPNINDIPE